MKTISLVVSVYNEFVGIRQFYDVTKSYLEEIEKTKGYDYELLFVNDGSTDGTDGILDEIANIDKRAKVVSFSRNFGHEAAMIAGLDNANGDILIFMDADLQHPPREISRIVEKMEEGYDVISMVREENKSAGIIKNITSKGFYWVINKMSDMKFEPNASDFFVINKKVQKVLMDSYRNNIRFLRGYVQNVGFKTTTLSFVADERIAGESHYSIKSLFKFSMNTIMCFSDIPLKLGIVSGFISAILGIIVLIYSLVTRTGAPSGYTTIVVLLCFMFALMFIVVGIIGQYIATIFSEMKDRPIYIVAEKKNFENER